METNLDKEGASQENGDSSKGWALLYGIVIGALAVQIVFYAWLTNAFQ